MKKYLISLNVSYSKDIEIEANSEEEARKKFEDNIDTYTVDAFALGEEDLNYEVVKEGE